jgi:NADH:ubiquinone oxidoreductase subunit B-like Fe-S oxidoreductase
MPLFRKNDILKHVFFIECSCCTPELLNLFTSKYDPERLSFVRTEVLEDADILIVNGYIPEPVLKKLEEAFHKLHKKPKVVAMGGCAVRNGPLKAPQTRLPIAVFIPGCPPRPETIIDGITRGLNL